MDVPDDDDRDKGLVDRALNELQGAERDHARARELRAQAEALDAKGDEEEREAERDLEKARDHHADDGTVTITVNTGDSREPKGSITYNRIVEIAYPDHTAHPNATYSILYERGPKANPEGTLSKGGSVFITNGMRFRAKRTGES